MVAGGREEAAEVLDARQPNEPSRHLLPWAKFDQGHAFEVSKVWAASPQSDVVRQSRELRSGQLEKPVAKQPKDHPVIRAGADKLFVHPDDVVGDRRCLAIRQSLPPLPPARQQCPGREITTR